MQGGTKFSTNYRILVLCLVLFALLGTTYYIDDRRKAYEPVWTAGVVLWYAALGITIMAVLRKTRNGYLVAGVLSWCTLVFCLVDNWHTVFHTSIIATRPNVIMTARNFVGAAIAALAVLSSHNSFHKASQRQDR